MERILKLIRRFKYESYYSNLFSLRIYWRKQTVVQDFAEQLKYYLWIFWFIIIPNFKKTETSKDSVPSSSFQPASPQVCWVKWQTQKTNKISQLLLPKTMDDGVFDSAKQIRCIESCWNSELWILVIPRSESCERLISSIAGNYITGVSQTIGEHEDMQFWVINGCF